MNDPRRLSDTELQVQLNRRANDEPALIEWRADFVGGVRYKIDTGIQVGHASRLPAMAGLAGALAVLALLVVAAPRFMPTGASPDATPDQAQPTVATRPTGVPAAAPSPYASPLVARGCEGTVKDETGLITRCRRAGAAQPGDAAPLTVSNPEGDDRVLAIEWASVCEVAGRFTFRTDEPGYELIAESDQPTNSVCDGFPMAHRLELDLRKPVDAADIVIRIAHMAHVCSPEPGQPFRNYATVRDDTAIVEWCEGIEATDDMQLPVTNPDGNLRILQLNWAARACDADADIEFTRLGNGFSIHGVLFQKTCRAVPGNHSLVLHLRVDVSADDVIVLFDRHTEPSPTP